MEVLTTIKKVTFGLAVQLRCLKLRASKNPPGILLKVPGLFLQKISLVERVMLVARMK